MAKADDENNPIKRNLGASLAPSLKQIEEALKGVRLRDIESLSQVVDSLGVRQAITFSDYARTLANSFGDVSQMAGLQTVLEGHNREVFKLSRSLLNITSIPDYASLVNGLVSTAMQEQVRGLTGSYANLANIVAPTIFRKQEIEAAWGLQAASLAGAVDQLLKTYSPVSTYDFSGIRSSLEKLAAGFNTVGLMDAQTDESPDQPFKTSDIVEPLPVEGNVNNTTDERLSNIEAMLEKLVLCQGSEMKPRAWQEILKGFYGALGGLVVFILMGIAQHKLDGHLDAKEKGEQQRLLVEILDAIRHIDSLSGQGLYQFAFVSRPGEPIRAKRRKDGEELLKAPSGHIVYIRSEKRLWYFVDCVDPYSGNAISGWIRRSGCTRFVELRVGTSQETSARAIGK